MARATRKKAYHHGNLREALVHAALRAIAEKGLDGFSLRDVAQRAGVSVAAPYRHFADREGLLAAVAAECAERHGAAMVEAVAASGSETVLETFRATGIAYVTFAVQHPDHFRVMSLPGVWDRVPASQRALADAWIADSRRTIAEAQRRGEIAAIDLDELLLTANSAVHGLASLIVEGKLGPIDLPHAVALAEAVTGALGVGFVPRPEGIPLDPRRAPAAKKRAR